MAVFIMAMEINAESKKGNPDLVRMIDESIDLLGSGGSKLLHLYATLGRYDYVAIFDAHTQAEAFRVASEINAKGILDTETWPVIPYDEFSKIIR